MVSFSGMPSASFFCAMAFKHPGHIQSQRPHGLKSFDILTDLFRLHTVNRIPVLGSHNGHLGQGKVFVQPVKSRAGPAASGADHQPPPLYNGTLASQKENPIQHRAQGAVCGTVIHRGTHYHPVGFLNLFPPKICHIVVKGTFPVFAQLPQAIQPRTGFFPSCRISVSTPFLFSSLPPRSAR